MSAQPDDDLLAADSFAVRDDPVDTAYAQGYKDGLADGATSERERIADALAADVAQRGSRPAPEIAGHTTWTSYKTGRKLRADVGRRKSHTDTGEQT